MMPRDKGGVVDSRFKVYGTSNIRVVDLSVLPLHTTVHPQGMLRQTTIKLNSVRLMFVHPGTVYTIAEMGKSFARSMSLCCNSPPAM